MARFYGKVGYVIPKETARGVWQDSDPIEYYYRGDILKKSTQWIGADTLNDDLKISARISIVADQFAIDHFSHIKYCELMGVKWKVIEVEPLRPRLVLTLGGEYNGQQA